MMADDLAEGSVYNQIKAIEGWALTAYQESLKKSPNVDEILENLRKINLQARKLEWRGKGLDSLPKGQLSEDLKKKITQLRAAVVTLRDIKKDKVLSSGSKRTIRVLTAVAAEAIKLVESLAIVPFDKFNTNSALLEDFLRGEGNFAHLTQEMRRTLWNNNAARKKVRLRRLDLHGTNLRGFDFSGMDIIECNFEKADLSTTSFEKSRISGKNSDWNYRMNNIDFSGTFIGANFHRCYLINLTLSGEIRNTNFSSAIFKKVLLKECRFEECNFQNAQLLALEDPGRGKYAPIFANSDLRRATIDLTQFSPYSFETRRPVYIKLDRTNLSQATFLVRKGNYPLDYDLDEVARKQVRIIGEES